MRYGAARPDSLKCLHTSQQKVRPLVKAACGLEGIGATTGCSLSVRHLVWDQGQVCSTHITPTSSRSTEETTHAK